MDLRRIIELNEELERLVEDLSTIKDKYYSDINQDTFDKIMNLDPTFRNNNSIGKYGKFLANIYKKNPYNLESKEIKTALEFYDKFKNQFSSNDIMRYKNIEDFLREYEDKKDKVQLSDRQKRKQLSKIDVSNSKDIDTIYEDDEWVLRVPKSYEASVKLGRNTKWCTAYSANDGQFYRYSEKGPLVVCQNKKTGEIYQYHKETESFMNKEDEPESIENILSKEVRKYLSSSDFKNYADSQFKIRYKEKTFADWFGKDLTGQTYYGDLDVDYEELTSLYGCPKVIRGSFTCNGNKLTSLEGGPEVVTGSFRCGNNKLTSLYGCPKIVDGSFRCGNNKLTSLYGCPKVVEGDFYCHNNNLTSLKGCPKVVKGDFDCYGNKLTSLEGCPEEVGSYFYCDDYLKEEAKELGYIVGSTLLH